jgi:hypothetical protein
MSWPANLRTRLDTSVEEAMTLGPSAVRPSLGRDEAV